MLLGITAKEVSVNGWCVPYCHCALAFCSSKGPAKKMLVYTTVILSAGRTETRTSETDSGNIVYLLC